MQIKSPNRRQVPGTSKSKKRDQNRLPPQRTFHPFEACALSPKNLPRTTKPKVRSKPREVQARLAVAAAAAGGGDEGAADASRRLPKPLLRLQQKGAFRARRWMQERKNPQSGV
jgi:hypothetical protein